MSIDCHLFRISQNVMANLLLCLQLNYLREFQDCTARGAGKCIPYGHNSVAPLIIRWWWLCSLIKLPLVAQLIGGTLNWLICIPRYIDKCLDTYSSDPHHQPQHLCVWDEAFGLFLRWMWGDDRYWSYEWILIAHSYLSTKPACKSTFPSPGQPQFHCKNGQI